MISMEEIFHLTDKLYFLVGSGISCNPPSCLPSENSFTKMLIKHLIPKELVRGKEVTFLYIISEFVDFNREEMRIDKDFLRFEALMGIIQRFNPELQVLNIYTKYQTPNLNHYFLAEMVLKGHNVLTTNFDSLIEYTLLESDYTFIKQIDLQVWRDRGQKKVEMRMN